MSELIHSGDLLRITNRSAKGDPITRERNYIVEIVLRKLENNHTIF